MQTEKNMSYWQLTDVGIKWNINDEWRLPHKDHLEMSGKYVSQHVEYEVKGNRTVEVVQTVVWPGLRLNPNDTHASMMIVFEKGTVNPEYKMNGKVVQERAETIVFDGILKIYGNLSETIQVLREYYPASEKRAAMIRLTLENTGLEEQNICVRLVRKSGTARGVFGINYYDMDIQGEAEFLLKPNEKRIIPICYCARRWVEPEETITANKEYERRLDFIRSTRENLNVVTPDPILNQAFNFAKIRSSESVFMTKAGLLHSPGGLHYYAGVWTNDQVEYAGPFSPYMGLAEPVEAAVNAYRLYIPFMGPGYECIPTSIAAEGNDIWEGKKDRGDCAMYAYGASRFALINGDRKLAEELFPAIDWCLEYSARHLNNAGVIESDSDELEGRFPAGTANLATSCLVYESLRTGGILAEELGETKKKEEYLEWREELKGNIEQFFGRTLKGFETYRYCDTSDALRSWICIPLTMGIFERKEGTIRALLSESLWTKDGLATMEHDTTFWDRSTLYGLRGIFCAGEAEMGERYLRAYSERRLLGEHVPYPVEAYPEGNQRHLSAESALYCRIYLEGILGISPEGLRAFRMKPSLPITWNRVQVEKIHGYGQTFDLMVERKGEKQYQITVKGKTEQVLSLREEESVVFTFE